MLFLLQLNLRCDFASILSIRLLLYFGTQVNGSKSTLTKYVLHFICVVMRGISNNLWDNNLILVCGRIFHIVGVENFICVQY